MPTRRAVAALAVVWAAVAGTPVIDAPAALAATQCDSQAGGTYNGTFWQQDRLDFRNAWPVSTGEGVTVAVLDSGVDATPGHVDLSLAHGINDVGDGTGTADCYKHGTEVAAIIAAKKTDSAFVGVAPGATILPIKIATGENGVTQAAMASGIRQAVDRGAAVINISGGLSAQPQYLTPLLRAVQYARAKHVLIVAAAGNDGSQSNLPFYPAAFSTTEDNVVAVSMTDADDSASALSNSGTYVTLAAPGVQVWVPVPHSGYLKESGTSYAAPYVTGTVALMLQADPSLAHDPAAIRDRLIATADPPAVAVPSTTYGYGIVDPYLAVTSVADDAPLPSSTAAATAVAQPRRPVRADHRLQHIAIAAALSLVGLALLIAVGAALVRAGRRNQRGLRQQPARPSRHRTPSSSR